MQARTAQIERKTRETEIRLSLNLDGQGHCKLQTGVGFFDHMLELLARHAMMDLSVRARGDLQVDAHHTVEDVGIVLGQAIDKALGDKRGIHRYGWSMVPMDDALAQVAIDLGGRPALVFGAAFSSPLIGEFPSELVEEFLTALVNNGKMNLHVMVPHGRNNHHIAEAIFKATAYALRQAKQRDPGNPEVPSTKGTL
ncbi:MAG: imidazoleglycerol-phosphate dehydratase HisB [Phycisphaerae bacterium]|nr:imidazoleglycerol-phosphate dehydratase HisB [Phycisphaerae bacterium]MDW8261147.1 imidazoleglycerol-phosphate dehydratase HisB [Phycisphaerales bacterium]